MIPAFDDRDGVIWLDGAYVDWRSAKIHVLTHGLHYGSCVFEGQRAYGGVVFEQRRHHERLHASARMLGFRIPHSVEELDRACEGLLDRMGFVDAYLRPVAWRGSEMIGVSAQASRIHVAIAAWEWPSYFSTEERLKGVRLAFARYRRPDPRTAPTAAKASGCYMICTISKHEAEAQGYADALMLDWEGYVAEATGANVFFVRDGVLHTPLADRFLDGITRRTVIRLAEAAGLTVVERRILPDELPGFQECFLTGTAAELTPVASIGEVTFRPGRVTQHLLDAYAAAVRPATEPRRAIAS